MRGRSHLHAVQSARWVYNYSPFHDSLFRTTHPSCCPLDLLLLYIFPTTERRPERRPEIILSQLKALLDGHLQDWLSSIFYWKSDKTVWPHQSTGFRQVNNKHKKIEWCLCKLLSKRIFSHTLYAVFYNLTVNNSKAIAIHKALRTTKLQIYFSLMFWFI